MEREFERRRYVFRVDPLPVSSVDLQSRRRASRSAFLERGRRLSQKGFFSLSCPSGCLGRIFLSEPEFTKCIGRKVRLAVSARACGRTNSALSSGHASNGAQHQLRCGRELETHPGELQRVLPLWRTSSRTLRNCSKLQAGRWFESHLGRRDSAPRRRVHLYENGGDEPRALLRLEQRRNGPPQR